MKSTYVILSVPLCVTVRSQGSFVATSESTDQVVTRSELYSTLRASETTLSCSVPGCCHRLDYLFDVPARSEVDEPLRPTPMAEPVIYSQSGSSDLKSARAKKGERVHRRSRPTRHRSAPRDESPDLMKGRN
ncbi:hypothetical protein EVAR_24780_1 [Eumeta japonica]|uniref:Uncharacterized protein n=1 Tax=Eumeta variegata TaxID=151549 RepID=A0A4C1W462_EUMVA|nr:hypothetical protein EVAR_24780_1 [Eumeta japonica]